MDRSGHIEYNQAAVKANRRRILGGQDDARRSNWTKPSEQYYGFCSYVAQGGNEIEQCFNTNGTQSITTCVGTPTPTGGKICHISIFPN